VAYTLLKEPDQWLVQVQKNGKRKTKRLKGTEKQAQDREKELWGELENEIKFEEARALLGVSPASASSPVVRESPRLRDFFADRWVEHAKVVQNDTTRRTYVSRFNYLLHYLGDKRLDELTQPATINAFVEKMAENGPLVFAKRKDGQPWRRTEDQFSNATINKTLQCLRALLFLAHQEGKLAIAPSIDLLPGDDSTPVVPPTEEQYEVLLKLSEDFRPVAPFMPEVIDFDAETGLRLAEQFNLSWASVERERNAVRVETQARVRLVNGRPWRPKYNKWREVPLSRRARAIIEKMYREVPHGPNDLVFPNRGGAPYVRMDRAPECSGKGFFRDVVAAAGLSGKVSFHSLRHLFAVRLLTRGVAITIVSELLGHSDINMTVKRYGRFATDAKVKWDAMRVLDRHPEDEPRPDR
jgi:integrase